MRSEKFEFTGHDGSMLAGRLDRPVEPPRATALFAHCFTCSKDILAAKRISQRLAGRGLAVLRFDFTGLGHSDGEFANTHFSSNIADLVAAAGALRDRFEAPSLLVGHSLGGAAVIAAAEQIPEVRAVATIGAPADPGHVMHNFGASLTEIAAKGEAEVQLAGRPFTIRQSFVEDVSAAKLDDHLMGLKRALLVMHAPRDETVGIENASQIFLAARHPKSFVALDNADHLLTRAEDADYAAEVITAWASRYLNLSKSVFPEPAQGVRAVDRDATGFLNRIVAPRGRSVVADEPRKVGGTDQGLSPFELVGAGLAACTSMTMRMYANRKDWPVGGIEVDVDWEQTDRHNTVFRREIEILGELTEDQRSRLLEIANKCPVHRMLEGVVTVETHAKEPTTE